MPLLKGVVDLSTAEVKDVGGFQEALLKLVAEIGQLGPGQTLMVPGGWDGNTGASTVVHLIEKGEGGGEDAPYAFVTCNSGQVRAPNPPTPCPPALASRSVMWAAPCTKQRVRPKTVPDGQ